jgi:hypothetical protein
VFEDNNVFIYLFTVIAMTSGAGMTKQCIVYQEGQCNIDACAKWCLQTYNGYGHCTEQVPSKCTCRYNCSN